MLLLKFFEMQQCKSVDTRRPLPVVTFTSV